MESLHIISIKKITIIFCWEVLQARTGFRNIYLSYHCKTGRFLAVLYCCGGCLSHTNVLYANQPVNLRKWKWKRWEKKRERETAVVGGKRKGGKEKWVECNPMADVKIGFQYSHRFFSSPSLSLYILSCIIFSQVFSWLHILLEIGLIFKHTFMLSKSPDL